MYLIDLPQSRCRTRTRTGSDSREDSLKLAGRVQRGRLVEDEDRNVGSVGWSVIKAYMRAAGGYRVSVAVISLFVLGE